MRLMEVGTKALSAGKKDEAYMFFDKAYTMYTLFWGLNLNALDEDEAKKIIKNIDPKTLENIDKTKQENNQEKTQNKEENIKTDNKDGSFSKLKNFVSKAVNCCRE